MNTGVIGLLVHDQTPAWPYVDASYIRASYQFDPGYGCTNVFYLLSHDPNAVHVENFAPDQQYYRVDDAASWDQDCDSRVPWAISSSVAGFVLLYAQYVPSQARHEMRVSTYTWLP